MGRPILFRHARAGRDGEPFELLKLRSMRPLREGETAPDADGARITPLGRFLRSTSIDELPSLVNVLRGDMAVVGPRPLPVRYLDRYTDRQRRRLDVRPGITGWAQINGRNAIGWDARLELDALVRRPPLARPRRADPRRDDPGGRATQRDLRGRSRHDGPAAPARHE